VNGERGDVNWADHASDGQRRAQLLAPLVEIVTEERGRQWGVDEAGRDEIDPDRRELEGEAARGRRYGGGDRRDDREAGTYPPAAGAADM
jgi:hypothetical protein